jgi:hypothetical protein
VDIDDLDTQEQREVIEDWLKHPGTRLVARKLRVAAKGMLREYDKADDPDRVRRIQISRWFIVSELPRMIEAIMNEQRPPRSWTWSFKRWLSDMLRRK